jgi:transcriptional regulator with XRE-family HTH domain
MDQVDKENIARLIREGRVAKGYTQQELSDLAGLSLRSVQRIENAEVVPRAYTLRVLFEKLEISQPTPMTAPPSHIAPLAITPPPAAMPPLTAPTKKLNSPRQLILTLSTAVLILLAIAAFIAQSPRFPETDFERFLLAISAIAVYTVILYRIWK